MAMDQQILEQESLGFSAPKDLDVFNGFDLVTPMAFLEKATELGIDPNLHPTPEDLCNLLIQLGANHNGVMSKNLAYRVLVLAHERRKMQRKEAYRAKLTLLAHTQFTPPTNTVFGPAPFVECLLKLALHRLGSKGHSEIQRGAPAWWKCTWLLTLLSGQFNENARFRHHERRLRMSTVAAKAATSNCGNKALCSPHPQKRAVELGMPTNDMWKKSCAKADPVDKQSPNNADAAAAKALIPRPLSHGEVVASMPKLVVKNSSTHSSPRGHGGAVVSRRNSRISNRQSSKGSPIPPLRRRHTVTAPSVDIPNLEKMPDVTEAVPVTPRERLAKELDLWYHCTQTNNLPQYLTPLDWLVIKEPNLFEPANAEAPLVRAREGGEGVDSPAPTSALCSRCRELRSPSGWGNPGCVLCGGTEEQCLPFENHLLGALLPSSGGPWMESPTEPSARDTSSMSSDSEQAPSFVDM